MASVLLDSVAGPHAPARRFPAFDDPSSFPELQFPSLPEYRDIYRRRVAEGYHIMRSRRVVITGLVRDVAAVLPKTIARVERLGRLFADYRAVFYENDSIDDTLAMVAEWQYYNPCVDVLSEVRRDPVNPMKRCPNRAQRMAYYRNQCHAWIAARYGDFDDVIVVDTDLVGGWSYDGIANTYGNQGWDGVGSYGLIYKRFGWRPNCLSHYDAWAFRGDSFQPLSTKQVNAKNWSRGEPLVPVHSCFGGLAIYRVPAYLSARYDGQDCEHVALHRQMRAAGYDRLYLNPSQITLYGRKRRTWDLPVSLCQTAIALCARRIPAAWY
jgi:hypothetical protein